MAHNIKNFKKAALLSLLMILGFGVLPNAAKACHLAAADIYIEYAGGTLNVCSPDYTYRITLTIYSSCNCGSTSGNNATIEYWSDDAATGILRTTLAMEVNDTIDQLCPQYSAQNQCITGDASLPAYKRRTYSGTVTLPSAQEDWKFSWSQSLRNPSTNVNSNSSDLYIEAGMDITQEFRNNTPRLRSNPLPYICAGQPYAYLNLPYDPDVWDSNKTYIETTIPLNDENDPLTYAGGYSPTRPINNYYLDRQTGTAYFEPINTGLYTISFIARDKYSYILRDAQIAVLPCTAPPPSMDSIVQNVQNATLVGVPGENDRIDSVVYVCPGSEFTFDVNASTDDPQHTIYMRSDLSLFNGATLTVNGQGTQQLTGQFSWQPTDQDYGEYLLVITTVDSTCIASQPIVLPSNIVVKIVVRDGLDAGPDLKICELNPQPIQLYVKGTENLRIKWSVADGGQILGFNTSNIYAVTNKHNPVIEYPFIVGGDTVFFPKTTDYIISTIDLAGTCKAVDTVRVELDTTNTVIITPKNPVKEEDALVMCRPGYLQMEALIKGKQPMNNLDCGTNNPTKCNTPEVLQINGEPLVGEDITADTLSTVSPVMYTNVRTAKKQFLITRGELWQYGLRSSSINGMSFEMTGFKNTDHNYNLTISFKCVEKDELNRKDGFENFGMTTVFSKEVNLSDGWQEFKFDEPYGAYNWDTTKNLLIELCYNYGDVIPCDTVNPVPIIRYAPTSYTSGLMLAPEDTFTTDVCNVYTSDYISAVAARPVFRFSYCEADPLPFDIRWVEGDFISDSTIAQPLAYVSQSERFVVQTIGRSTCIMRDTLDVYVPENNYEIVPDDTAFCYGEKVPFSITGGGSLFRWYEFENGQYNTPESVTEPGKNLTIISPEETTEYRVVVSDSVWCFDTLSAKIKILPLPDVRILNKDDTTVKYGSSFQLLATGARFYNWSPVSSVNNPNISYPIAYPTEDTKYIVGGIATNGCRAFDTLHVIVDKHDNLFVPSAFSPNGDGKNDLFRITNLSFQRVMEFRVFNRWGQEVFSTNDSRGGWDGTWAGVPQEIGVYNYLIRVAYPDGFVETYRGETTLIR